jgi:hypothetical protein
VASRSVATRLASTRLRPAFVEELTQLLAPEVEQLQQHPPVVDTFATLSTMLQAPAAVLNTFRAAWTLMYATIGRLDSLQDDDPIETPPQLASLGAHYNLVFASYLVAVSLLDDLAEKVPTARLHRLQRWWNDSMLRMADGQQRDLASADEPRAFDTLAVYQAIAQAKTGATYALAFGGMAVLCTDDEALVDSLAQVGEIFGTFLQYTDDLSDAISQPNAALTLPELLRFLPLDSARQPEQIAAVFCSYLYPIYLRAVLDALGGYPGFHDQVTALFAAVFIASNSPATG